MPTPTNSDILIGLYRSFFLRAPDAPGYNDWITKINAGTELSEIAAGFLAHPYAQNNLGYAPESAGGLNDEDFVKAVYNNLLNGTGSEVPTQDEIDYWVGLLSDAENPMSRSDMVLKFVTDSLSIDFTDEEAWPDAAVREAGQKRQDAIINSNDVAKTFITALGDSTAISEAALTDPNLLASDPAFLASQRILEGVTYDPSTSNNAKSFITNTAATSGNPVNTINSATDEQIFGTGGGVVGQTFTLTVGQDTIPGLIGSNGTADNSGDDTINGAVNITAGGTSTANTFSAADVINAGDGTDTLNVIVENANLGGALFNLPAAAISNVEIFNLRNVENAGSALTVDAANFLGETEINSDRSTNTVTITNMGTGAAAGIIGTGAGGNGALNFGYQAPADAATLNVRGGVGVAAQPAVTITSAPTAVTINSTGGANSLGAVTLSNAATVSSLTIDAATSLSTGGFTGLAATGATITVKGDATGVSSPVIGGAVTPQAATVTLGNIAPAVNLASIDASSLTAGGVQVGMNAASTNLQFKGGQGNDNVTTNGGTALLATASIDAGAGTADRLVVANTADILVAAGSTSKARGDLYKGFEQVQVQDGQALDVTLLSTNNTIDTVRIADGANAAGTTVTNLTATQAANVAIVNSALNTGANATGAITIGVAGAGTSGQIDTVKATVQTTDTAAVNNNLTGIVLTGVENLELTGSNGAVAANVGTITLDTSAATSLSSIKLNNANSVNNNAADNNVITINAGHTATNLVINAAGSGDTTINAAAYAPAASTTSGVAITGGAGNDVITGSARADSITLGGGSDTFFLSSANQAGTPNLTTHVVDTINDFVLGTGGDVLETSNLANNLKPVLSGTASATLVTALNSALPTTGTAGNAELIILDSSVTALQAANASALNNLTFNLAGSNQGQVLVAYAASATGDVRIASATITGGDINNVVDLAILKNVTTASLNTGFVAANLAPVGGAGYQQFGNAITLTAPLAVVDGVTNTFATAVSTNFDDTITSTAANLVGSAVDGLLGTDSLTVTTATALGQTLAGVTNVDILNLANVANSATGAGALTGLAGFDTINGGTNNDFIVLGKAGQTFIGNGGTDEVNSTIANLAGATLTFGAAADVLNVTDAGAVTLAATVTGLETVNLTGISQITTNQTGITVVAANAATNVTGNGVGNAVAINAANIADNTLLTTAGAANLTITGLIGDLSNTATGTVAATLAGTGSADTTRVTSTTPISVANGTFAVADTIEVAGSGAFTITGDLANVTQAAGFTGSLNVTTAAGGAQTITTVATAGTTTVVADTLADTQTLNLAGASAITVNLALGDLAAAAYTGNITLTNTAASTGTNIIVTGSGNDVITAGGGIDVITSGLGNDQIHLAETVAVNDVIRFAAAGAANVDTVTGFAVNADAIAFFDGAIVNAAGNKTISFGDGTSAVAVDTIDVAITVVANGGAGAADASTALQQNFIKATSAVATSYATALGTSTVTVAGQTAGEALIFTYYDSAAGQAVVGLVDATTDGVATNVSQSDAFAEVARITMTGVDYTALNQTSFAAFI